MGGVFDRLSGAGTRRAVPIATAEWLELEFAGPDGRKETVVRDIFDLSREGTARVPQPPQLQRSPRADQCRRRVRRHARCVQPVLHDRSDPRRPVSERSQGRAAGRDRAGNRRVPATHQPDLHVDRRHDVVPLGPVEPADRAFLPGVAADRDCRVVHVRWQRPDLARISATFARASSGSTSGRTRCSLPRSSVASWKVRSSGC